jgi:hypothetical protein
VQPRFKRVLPIFAAACAASFLVVGNGFFRGAGAVSPLPRHAGGLVAVEPAGTGHLPPGTALIGSVSAAEKLRSDVNLRLPDPAAVAHFIAAVSDPASPLFHKFLPRGAFGPRFGPSEATVAAVVAALRAAGLHPGTIASDRLSIPVTATARTLEAALHTTINTYRLRDGRDAYANATPAELPSAIAAAVSGIIGLSDVATFTPRFVAPNPRLAGRTPAVRRAAAPSAGPQACSQATAVASKYGAFTSNQLASYYGMSPLYGAHDYGQGVYVGLVEFDTFATSDISAFQKCVGTDTPYTIQKVDGFHKTGIGGGEPVLDVEDFLALAPQSTIDVYETPNTIGGAEAIYTNIINGDVDNVVSTSWGLCEPDSTASFLNHEHTLFMQAAAQGQAVFAAAGDYGSTDCYNDGTFNNSLAVDDPSSQDYVVGVGGTTIKGPGTQTVWNSPNLGATGGGVSSAWCMPSYQYTTGSLGVINPESLQAGSCSTGYAREVPDVSADADPYTGLVVYYSGSFFGQGGPTGWQPIGGTSVAAPLWAALAVLTDASPFCSAFDSGTPGGLPQALYGVANGSWYHNGFYDVPQGGSNDLTATGYNGGLYTSLTGYDMSTGIGTPIGIHTNGSGQADFLDPGLVAVTCHAYARRGKTASISRISPDSAPLGQQLTTVITGSGFVPLAGAESIQVGSKWYSSISCTSSTTCTATIPASAVAGKVDLRINVAGLDETSAATFGYAKPGQLTEGYWLASANGSVFPAGAAPILGGVKLGAATRIRDLASTPDGRGYWLVSQDGSVYPKGDARFFGDLPSSHVAASDIVAIAPTGDGRGYWLIGRDGGEFAYGDARYHGSLPGLHLHVDDIVGMVATSDGGGYWLVASDGGIFAFGDATYKGSLPGIHVRVNDIAAMIASPTREGYVLVGRDGGAFVFGTGVRFFGSLPGRGVNVHNISGLALTGGGLGYWFVGSNGAVYNFGDAESLRVGIGVGANLPIVAIASAVGS